MSVRIQLRRDTAANWASTNPTLTQGEPGYETDTGKIKYGDGSTAWNSLAYAAGEAFAAGSASAPSITFSADTNTGLYSPGADQVAISTNGSGRLFVDASGDVGVGTASPDPGGQGLHVHNASAADSSIRVTNSTTGATNGDGFAIQVASDGTARLRQFENVALTFETNATERARITSSGQLLVGTSSARGTFYNSTLNYPLAQIEGTSFATSGLSITRSDNSGSGGALLLANQRSGTLNGNGLVSSGDGLGVISFQGGDGTNLVEGAKIQAQVDGTPGTNDLPSRLVFSTTPDGDNVPDEVMRITSNKYVRLASGTGGIQFRGDTAAANALDDYEEGTWGDAATMSNRRYVKIGRLVHLTIEAAIPTSGAAFSKTLPFAVETSTAGYSAIEVGSWFVRYALSPYTVYTPVEAAYLRVSGTSIFLGKSGSSTTITKSELEAAIGGGVTVQQVFASVSYYAEA